MSSDVPAGSSELAVVARDVTRSFGQVYALRGLDLVVPYGTVTGLVGPNGAGKTTLLLILATLLAPDSGVLRVAGLDPAAQPGQVRSRIGWMPDTMGVYDQLTATEYLTFFGRAHRLAKPAAKGRAVELLNMIHLEDFADSPVHVLSRGQKQRLALARALVHRPALLLLDEPASGLDPRSRIELRDLLRMLAAQGVSVLVSSHILTEMEEIADKVVFISRGRVVSEQELSDISAAGQGRNGWRVRATDADALAAALAERQVVVTDRTAAGTDLAPMSEDEAADLLVWLVSRNVRVVAFGPTGSTLESVYLSMTEERR